MYNQKNIRQPDYSKMTLREELEARFKQLEAEEARRKKEQSLIPQPDYSKMSLREELEARFAEMEKQEKAKQQTLGPKILPKQEPNIWDNLQSTAAPIAAGAQGFAQGAYEAGQDVVNQLYQGGEAFGNAIAQGQNAVSSLVGNYNLMTSHKYKYLDDYYHCKGNYQAAQAGPVGELTAHFLGNAKEGIDYFKNRYYKGLSANEALVDAHHDLYINQIGRNRANNGINYLNASEACRDFRDRNKKLPFRYY